MRVTFAGTRGSVPIAGKESSKYGGNTTCLRVESPCLPEGHWLFVDAGTGIVPLGMEAVRSQAKAATILFTHYHHDHTQGLLLCPLLFAKKIPLFCLGPEELGIGPQQMLEAMIRPPFFPLTFAEVASHIHPGKIESPRDCVIAVHPEGGFRVLKVDELEQAEFSSRAFIQIEQNPYPLNECLVIRMTRSNHPERTLSYRFEERPTGRTFVFLTDHENQAEISGDLQNHLRQADLLVMDSQYPQEKYARFCSGFGHGTPEYCVQVASRVQALRLGLTHHDPFSTDEDVEKILAAAQAEAERLEYTGDITACADGLLLDL
jgi:phosphoribosyl 1,2-cyclic phosphodiesterase